MTIHECCKPYKDVNKTTSIVHYAQTTKEAIEWLESNGGGIYKNTLHKYQFDVAAKSQSS